MSYCEKCHGSGGHYDNEVPDQWYWCDACDAAKKHYEAKRLASLSTEDWIREQWGGFTYLILGRNKDFMLDYENGNLYLHYENDNPNSPVGRLLIKESPTKREVSEIQTLFGQRSCNRLGTNT